MGDSGETETGRDPREQHPRSALFVGRERELAELSGGLSDALGGHGRVFLIVGEPGIGKTRLAGELGDHASRRGAQVLWGRCWEGEGAPPYWPWMQVLRSYLREADPETIAQEMGSGAPYVAQIVPEVRERLGALPPPPTSLESEHARFALFVHPAAATGELFRFYREFACTGPDELTCYAQIGAAPDGTPIAALQPAWCGAIDEGEKQLRPIRGFGAPIADDVAPMPYTSLQTSEDGTYPSGRYNYWTSHFLAELTDEVIDTLVACGARRPSPLCQLGLEPFAARSAAFPRGRPRSAIAGRATTA